MDVTSARRRSGLVLLILLAALGVAAFVINGFVTTPDSGVRLPDEDLPLELTHVATSVEQAAYNVSPDTVVLGEITSTDLRVVGGASHYSVRFSFQPYLIDVRCRGDSLGIQENTYYFRNGRLKVNGAGGHIACGNQVYQRIRIEEPIGPTVTIDVIELSGVEGEWGVLIICQPGRLCA